MNKLVRRLRDLPEPPIPDGLKARLLEAIPRRERARRSWWIIGMSGATAAAVIIGITLLGARPPSRGEQALKTEVSPNFVLKADQNNKQETQSCYVLPLLPES
jgi:hypothetical protein